MSTTCRPSPPKLSPIDSQIFTRKKKYITYDNLLDQEIDIILKINKINIYFGIDVLNNKFTIRTMSNDTYTELTYLFKILLNFTNQNLNKNINSTIFNTINKINTIFQDSLEKINNK
tara:strand:- start:45 stop:395 length:351 start_codon:yes stop_codon:yes gene_type:complete